MTNGTRSEALTDARSELLTIVGELTLLRARLLRTGQGLRKAAKTAPVVDTHPSGEQFTVERWIADYVRDLVSETLDGFIDEVAGQADFEGRLAELHAYVERERAAAAAHQAGGGQH